MNDVDIVDIYEKSNNDLVVETGRRFRDYRRALRLTQREVCAQSGISMMTLNRFEGGKGGSISFQNLVALFRAIQRLEDIAVLLPEIPESLYGGRIK